MNPVAFPLVMAAAQAVTHAVDSRLAPPRSGSGSERESLLSHETATESRRCGRTQECTARDELAQPDRVTCAGQGSVKSGAGLRNGALLEGSVAGARGANAGSVSAEGGVATPPVPDVGVSGTTSGGTTSGAASIESAVREALATILQTILSQVSELLTGILTGALPRSTAGAAGDATSAPRGALTAPVSGSPVSSATVSSPAPSFGGDASGSAAAEVPRQGSTDLQERIHGHDRASSDVLSSFALHVLSGIRNFLSTGMA